MAKLLPVDLKFSPRAPQLPIGVVATVGTLLMGLPGRELISRRPPRPIPREAPKLDPALRPSPADLDRIEALARAGGDHPLGRELVQMVATVRRLAAAVQMLVSELDGDD
jgi:hypothetical protein